MARAALLHYAGGAILQFWCPGCDEAHGPVVERPDPIAYPGPVWEWNGSLDRPTIAPSIRVSGTKMTPEAEARWRQGARLTGDVMERMDTLCHSFVRDGRIEFLGDCSHALAGQTVDLPEWEE
ncbi:MAG TPA: DUF6527 family protein [Gemmatimonadaceae bacterium]|nr:DUF6527 family protein [Gemmatimonadaceae bacterium]